MTFPASSLASKLRAHALRLGRELGVEHELVERAQARPRHGALHRNAVVTTPEELEQLHFEGRARREIHVPAFARDHADAGGGRNQDRFTEPGAGAQNGRRRFALDHRILEDDELVRGEFADAECHCVKIVDQTSRRAERLGQPLRVDDPRQVRRFADAALDGTRHAKARSAQTWHPVTPDGRLQELPHDGSKSRVVRARVLDGGDLAVRLRLFAHEKAQGRLGSADVSCE